VLIGPALVLTSLILAFGLGVTVLSDLPSLRLFGKLSGLTLVAALIGDLLLLPASVLLYRRLTRSRPVGGSKGTRRRVKPLQAASTKRSNSWITPS